MNSETIIVVIGLCLVTMYILFRTRFLILLNRLASFEFHLTDNLKTKAVPITKDAEPWVWHKVLLYSFWHPNQDTWNRLLSENNISFIKAYSWITISSLLFPLVYSIVEWVKFSSSITVSIALSHIKNILLIGIFEPIGFVALTGTVHILAKFFGKGNYQNFFVVLATSYVPISLLYTFAALFRWSFLSKAWLYAGVLLHFYFTIFVATEIIKFNYRVNLLIALVINVAVTALSFFVAYQIYCLTGFGI